MRPPSSPFRFAAAAALAAATLTWALGGPAGAALQLAPMITGLNAGSFANDGPIAFVDPDDGLAHRLVVMHNGRVVVWEAGGLRTTPWLDLSAETGSGKVLKSSASSERGLLALAVHPGFRDNGLFYVYYTSTNWDGAGPIANGCLLYTSPSPRD